jgi:predicted nucleic acid-binding protein
MATDSFVLDCSVALSWCFVDEHDAYALDVLRSLSKAKAIVPAIWPSEVANGLLMGERRKRSTEADTTKWLSSLAALPIEVDVRGAPEFVAAVTPLARAHGLTSYDASYLEVAVRRNLPVATMESRLQAVAQTLGLKLYRPKPAKRRK